jgi:hypothetical protein
MAEKLETLARRADIVIVANLALMSWARSAGARNILLVPTVVDIDRYAVCDEPKGQFTIGWIGTPLNLRYLETIAGPLRHLSDHGARLLLIGAPPDFALRGVAVEAMPWSEDTEAAAIACCHIGIMPLEGSPWEQFKSGYKLIQYMAAGRAVVASPIGANLDIVRHGETGFLANDNAQWLAALKTLRDRPDLRMRFGSAGRQLCAAQFSLSAAFAQIEKALSRCCPDLWGVNTEGRESLTGAGK